ncbi:MAG: hypothetical protein U9Q62_01150 [Campylobacterota bacterium]|nr:hypothetical protein [Campylobacterota bacterium]
MENLYTLVIVIIMLEVFEVQWQKADSMMGMLLRMHKRYKQSILWFLILHPTFYFTVWFAMVTDYSVAALCMLFIKTVDIATKILLIQQVFEKRELSQEMTMMLLTPLHPLLPYIGLLVYPPMVVMALL